jgi:ABC-type transporter lipoprotein component MlaA
VQNKENFYTITNDLSYQKTYDTSERAFSMSLTHTFLKANETKLLDSRARDGFGTFDPLESLNRNTYINKHIHNVIIQLDYTQPLKAKG